MAVTGVRRFHEEPVDSSGGIAAERGQSRSFSDRPSSLQSLRQEFSQGLGRAWGVRSGEESEGILLRVWEADGSQEPPCFLFFFLFFLRLGASIVLRRAGLFVCWEPCVPAGTAGTVWNPYK